MTIRTSSDIARGISTGTLAFAVLGTALLTGLTTWWLIRPVNDGDASPASAPAFDVSRPVVVTPEAQRNAGLTIVAAERRRVPSVIDVTGTVTAVESRVAHVRPLARGLVERVWVRLGDRVTKGQPLATYDNIELGELVGQYVGARAVLRQSEADLDVKRKLVERGRALATLEAIAQQTLDLREAELVSAQAAVARDEAAVFRIEEQLHRFGLSDPDIRLLTPGDGRSPHREASHTILRAPFDGVVTTYDIAEGELAEPERELFTVTDLSTVWVLADIYEKDILAVRTGVDAIVRVDAYPNRAFVGTVDYVADVIDPQSRTAKARVLVENPDAALKLQMFARLRLPTADLREAVLVPVSAVQTVDRRSVVFVPVDDRRFVASDVELGTTTGSVVEIRAGLEAGERIVSTGSFHLKAALLRERIADEP